MKKIIMAAGIAASMLFATSAFAEIPNTITAEYNPKTGNITLTGDGVTEKATTTYLVISRGETEPTGAFTGTIDDTMIKQINQVDGTSTVATIYVGTGLADGFYEVRVGGDGSVVYDTFEVKTVVTPPDLSTQEGAKEYYKTCTRKIGDIDDDGTIGLSDAGLALAHELSPSLTGIDLQAGDVDGDLTVGLADAGIMLAHELGDYSVIDENETAQVKDKELYILESSAE